MKLVILITSLFFIFSCSKTNNSNEKTPVGPVTNPGDTTKTPPADTTKSFYDLSLKDTTIVFGPGSDTIILHLVSLDTAGNIVFTAKIPQLDSAEFMKVKITMNDSKKNVESDYYNVYREEKQFKTFINKDVYIVSVKID